MSLTSPGLNKKKGLLQPEELAQLDCERRLDSCFEKTQGVRVKDCWNPLILHASADCPPTKVAADTFTIWYLLGCKELILVHSYWRKSAE